MSLPYPEERKYTELPKSEKRGLGDDPVPAPGHRADHVPANYRDVLGWGADLDPAVRPAYPKELPTDVTELRGPARTKQVPRVKIHQSIEQRDLPPVFGTACPPKGLSGLMRDYAYQFSEATNRHWITLLLADRVDVLENLVGDAFRGHPDHYVKEKGWGARIRYAEPQTKYLLFGAAAVGAVALGFFAVRALRDRD
jgi:hypothetical protein